MPTPNSHGSKMSNNAVSMHCYRPEARKALAVMLGNSIIIAPTAGTGGSIAVSENP